MATLKPDEEPGWNDGPSRPGVGARRAIIAVIGALFFMTMAFCVSVYVAIAYPGLFGQERSEPPSVRAVTSTLTINLRIARNDWSRLIQATDRLAARHGLADKAPMSELQQSRMIYEGKDAELKIERVDSGMSVPTVEICVTIREFEGSGTGQPLKAAFENDVVRGGGFTE